MKHTLHSYLATLVLAIIMSGCSVKEDRVGCPCLLSVTIAGKCISPTIVDFVAPDKGMLKRQELNIGSDKKEVSAKVPKGRIYIAGLSRPKNWFTDKSELNLYLNPGNNADSVFAGASVVECYGEKEYDTLYMHKQWCHLQIILEEPDLWHNTIFEVRGRWGGLSIPDMMPIKGDFLCRAERSRADRLETSVLRQGDNTLTLKAYEMNDKGEKGGLTNEFLIGEMIAKSEYDWQRKDLDDIVIVLSLSSPAINVEVIPWNEGNNEKEIEF